MLLNEWQLLKKVTHHLQKSKKKVLTCDSISGPWEDTKNLAKNGSCDLN